jgi:hypothetical protein
MYPTGAPSPGFHDGYTFDFKWIDLAKPPQKSEMGRFLQSESKEDTMLKQRGLYIWSNIVLSYMRRSLTHEQDKLIAISGVAWRLQSSVQSEYLAGLWKTNLPLQLLWTSYFKENHTRRTATYCAPSWSWASVTGYPLQHLSTTFLPGVFKVSKEGR